MPNLYLTEQGSQLEREAGQLLVTKHGAILLAVPATRVETVIVVGNCGITTPALTLLLERGIGLIFLTSNGAFRGRLITDLNGSLDIRRMQYQRAADDAFCLRLGAAMIAGKVHNARAVCMRRDGEAQDPDIVGAAAAMREVLAALPAAHTRAEIMGLEGQAARYAFGVLARSLRPPWVWQARARRPPTDPVNCLISVLSTLLHESCYAALQTVGLDPACGFLHTPRPGRAALALDLMEEFRPLIVDSLVLTLLNKRMLQAEHFVPGPRGAVYLSQEGWRAVAQAYARRLQTLVTLPGRSRRVSYQKVLEVQARAVRRAIMDDAPYEPFLVR